MRALSALGCLGLAAGFLVGGPAHRTSSLLPPTHARPQLMMASFTQNAPPAPPPVVSSGGGGGGGDDGRNEYLRLLDVDEQSELLADWIARARIYKMNPDAEIAARQGDSLPVLTDMSAWRSDPTGELALDKSVKQLLLGLCDERQIWAVATAEIRAGRQLLIRHLAVYPSESNSVDSTAALRMMRGLRALASIINVQLVVEDLKHINKGRFWLTAMALLGESEELNTQDEGGVNTQDQ